MQLCSTPNAPVYPSSLSDVLNRKSAEACLRHTIDTLPSYYG
ncbi:hypothetical protein HMPREF0454_03472 [Hafnia alvei ATCC 51873]|uniref:Uncharacterized protein n=1 Tax=Hafnia alvei ATCC 51873 TaxID=1002364 RepID=G9YA52_HAFAL|nr:hypothetical protein HMPREF0454_03472 [Hafnia alvei ATCC 51873]